jgi:aspartate kinase
MSVVVAKFGGSSLADAAQILKCKKIIEADPNRRYIVPSAPGKRFSDDEKITDLLYRLYYESDKEKSVSFQKILQRYGQIRDELGLTVDIEAHIRKIPEKLNNAVSADFAASRGEYLNGLLLADLLGYDFIDAADVIFFDEKGAYDHEKTIPILSAVLKKHERAVIPGFYGSMPDGSIKTFSRGGSDITGSIVACASGAVLYENWTDVSGFMKADPRIVKDPKKIDVITYRELRELSYMGATVLHEDSIFPVLQVAIPIHVKNTNAPENSGTVIIPSLDKDTSSEDTITGIAGKKDFTVITIEKNGMNTEIGFGRRVLSCLEKYDISFEHIPSGIDSLCVVIADCKVNGCVERLVDEIHRSCTPDSVEVSSNMALIATVGRGMIRRVGISAKLFAALAENGVNVRMIDQGSSEMNIIVGVENDDFEKAVRAIYDALV